MQADVTPCASIWFERASRWFIERHQGCPWCRGSHCLFRSRRPDRVHYSCSECDFFVCHTPHDNGYFVAPGQLLPAAPR